MKTVSILLLGLAISLSGCSLHQRQEMEYAHYQDDAAAIREAYAAWLILSSPNRSREWPEARKKYNACIRELAAHLKEAKRKGGMDEEKRLSLPFVIEKSPYARDSNPWFYEAIFMSDEVDPTFRLRESVTVEGMGIPLAGLAPRGGSRPHANVLKDNGNVHTLTAILDFDRMVDGKPTLRTIPRLMNEHIFIGKNKVRQPLAANFSVPIALFWKLSDADGTELLGAFRPKKAINTMGLYFSEPYDPRKIPVVFTHGLMSGPATFANLTNRLLVDPVIRENYQFWFFGYPSGLAWTIPASRQRQALKELMQEYNPRGTSREMNNIVMVGHSMGGLITRFNNSTKPWTLMKGVFELSPETFEGMTLENWKKGMAPLHYDEQTLERLQNNFIFSPPQGVTRIVYMATPHRGSTFADNWIGRLGQRLIDLPSDMLEEVTRIATLSRGMFLLNPLQLKDELTSIRQLSPNSSLVKYMSELRGSPNVPVHSIIGDRGRNDTPNSSDGVVKYHSSHLDWSASEKIVPSGHSVQDDPASALELRRILREHLVKVKGRKTLEEADAKAATPVWQANPSPPIILKRP
ncbi:alpha/beta hydrolase [Akkermansia muciniphila]|uniref:esterase/lipase family protein n=1 Tax=Akkermansia muciniphila TaxID=239935 RepID=UPI00080C9137|nr:alpha/beta hydrolase [Akkermansia muciniphila]ANU61395.1 alpha/beta hydrolase [Akkermansia muciniphila]ASB34887.1 alpha/beta hydrolase [Akkermansia muciniphila]QQR32348.1 alpha/beta hydrolase [Akkermansia muciniphila]